MAKQGFFFIVILIFTCFSLCASDQTYTIKGEQYIYSTPHFSEVFTTMPKNYSTFLKDSFSKEALPGWAAIAVSTGVLLYYDRPLINEVRKWGRDTGVGNSDATKPMIRLFGVNAFRGPTDVGSLLYFIGDGWTTIGFLGGFFAYGKKADDNRALQTSAQLLQGLLLTGLTTQILKRSTGRESPSVATTPTGKWKPFPSTSKFQKHGVQYNAFPSGHLATVMTSFTIITENYAEYSFIKPVGYATMGLLGLQMMNNNAHWISDYPLALGIGYMLGHSIAKNGRKKVAGEEVPEKVTYEFTPYFNERAEPGVALVVSY